VVLEPTLVGFGLAEKERIRHVVAGLTVTSCVLVFVCVPSVRVYVVVLDGVFVVELLVLVMLSELPAESLSVKPVQFDELHDNCVLLPAVIVRGKALKLVILQTGACWVTVIVTGFDTDRPSRSVAENM
ncbi:MAG: hypothetical protein AAB948_00270, partial [Patescibacteria group bacterium]